MVTPASGQLGRANPVQKLAQINNTAQLVSLWLLSNNKSSQTQKQYVSSIRQFIAWLTSQTPNHTQLNDVDLRTLTLNDLLAYSQHLEIKGLKPRSRSAKLAAVKSLLRFGNEVGWLQFNVGKNVAFPEIKQDLSERILSEMEVMKMIALTPPGRDFLLLKFLYYTGARVGEVGVETLILDGRKTKTSGLRWHDVQPGHHGNGKVTLFGKGGKTRTVLIPAQFYQELGASRIDGKGYRAVFPSRKGQKPLNVRQIQRIVKGAAVRAGLSEQASTHWLRHAHATHALNRGAAPQLVQVGLGHASLETTTKYAHANPTDSSGLYLPR